ncbi:unnamed protein product, partial [Mesorhabditis belari]|uniref:Uncharacterized protein n=1 Tax=Mesorhabditis belari TaxID=2138241 RepID=A0AAF3EYP8_9BILA
MFRFFESLFFTYFVGVALGDIVFKLDLNNPSFLLWGTEINVNSLLNVGFNNYLLAEYSYQFSKYEFSFQSNSSTSAALTVMNRDYMNAIYYSWDLQNVVLTDGCSMDIYVGGHPVETGEMYLIYTLSADRTKAFIPSSFLSGYYTFIIPPNCQASFKANKTDYTNLPQMHDGSHGFVASWEYPGGTFNRQLLGFATETRLITTDAYNQMTYPIFADVVGLTAGDQGNLTIGFYQRNSLVTAQTLTTASNIWYNETKVDELRLSWTPGYAGRKGFLVRYRFGTDNPDIYSINEYSLVFDSRRKTKKMNRIECPGCKIEVNAVSQMNPGTVLFSDATTTATLSELIDKPYSFKDFVAFNNVDSVKFLASFTSYDDLNRASMGLDDYTIYEIDSKNGQGLIIDAKPNYRAVTMYNYLVPFKMWIGNVTMSEDCEISLYVGGIPPQDLNKAKSLEIFRFRSNETSQFSRSGITPAASTLIVPPKCSFRADFAQYMDGIPDPLTVGSKGFMMSGEYPGVQDSETIQPVNDRSQFAITQSNTGSFSLTIPMADPGDGGVLSVHNEKITSTVLNKAMSFSDSSFEVIWNPSQKSRHGFLILYEVLDVTKSGFFKSFSPFLMAIFLVLELY